MTTMADNQTLECFYIRRTLKIYWPQKLRKETARARAEILEDEKQKTKLFDDIKAKKKIDLLSHLYHIKFIYSLYSNNIVVDILSNTTVIYLLDEIMPIRRKTLFNQSINQSQFNFTENKLLQ